jgi:hypothetical protein
VTFTFFIQLWTVSLPVIQHVLAKKEVSTSNLVQIFSRDKTMLSTFNSNLKVSRLNYNNYSKCTMKRQASKEVKTIFSQHQLPNSPYS